MTLPPIDNMLPVCNDIYMSNFHEEQIKYEPTARKAELLSSLQELREQYKAVTKDTERSDLSRYQAQNYLSDFIKQEGSELTSLIRDSVEPQATDYRTARESSTLPREIPQELKSAYTEALAVEFDTLPGYKPDDSIIQREVLGWNAWIIGKPRFGGGDLPPREVFMNPQELSEARRSMIESDYRAYLTTQLPDEYFNHRSPAWTQVPVNTEILEQDVANTRSEQATLQIAPQL
jgi:hypothetical protein